MSIASKEAREAHFWLRLLRDAEVFNNDSTVEEMIIQADEIVRILTSIVKTSKEIAEHT
jgi:four helix bundle protein